jgi:hypothetical protein
VDYLASFSLINKITNKDRKNKRHFVIKIVYNTLESRLQFRLLEKKNNKGTTRQMNKAKLIGPVSLIIGIVGAVIVFSIPGSQGIFSFIAGAFTGYGLMTTIFNWQSK